MIEIYLSVVVNIVNLTGCRNTVSFSFIVIVMRHPDKNNIREGGFPLAHSSQHSPQGQGG